jgi:hypothetical protein
MQLGSRRVQVVAAVFVVALLGGAFAYYTSVGGGETTTSSTSTQSTEISIPGSGGTGTRSTTSTTSTSTAISIQASTTLPCTSAAGASSGPTSLPDYVPLFSTISQMTMQVQQIVVDQYGRVNTTAATVGYMVAGQTAMNGTKVYVVNLQVSTAGANGTSNVQQATALIEEDGSLYMVEQPNLNATGASAVKLVSPFLDPFNYELTTVQQLATYTNPNLNTILNQTRITLGTTNMTVTYAQPKAMPTSITVCGQTTVVESVLFAFGVFPGPNTTIITYYYSLGTDGVSNVVFGYKVVSATKA